MRNNLSVRRGTRLRAAVVVGGLALAAVTVLPGSASAQSMPCGDPAVPLPGDTAVVNGPAHQGKARLSVVSTGQGVAAGYTGYRIRLSESNHTGAGYEHVTPELGVLAHSTKDGTSNLTPRDVSVQWFPVPAGADPVSLPIRGHCDPTLFSNSAALDGALADGEQRSYDLVVLVDSTKVRDLASLDFVALATADGTVLISDSVKVTTGNPPADTAPKPRPTAQPTPKPTGSHVQATPTAKPSVAPVTVRTGERVATGDTAPQLAETGTPSGTMVGLTAFLIAAAGTVAVAASRRTRHIGRG